MRNNVVIVDYGMGNVHSVHRKITRLQADCKFSSDPKEILAADKLILPGVGHFGRAMQSLQTNGLVDCLSEAVLVNKRPILGICLGMQLMADFSEEGMCNGLGWVAGRVIKFQFADALRHKSPHTGWNDIRINKESRLMLDVSEGAEFYFVHSYHFDAANASDVLNTSVYERPFTSAIERDNIFGVQYHPEKSHAAGELLLRNFIRL